jgi:hypothetical protein
MRLMHDGLIHPGNSSQGDNLGKSRNTALDRRAFAYDIPTKARGLFLRVRET